MRKLDWLVTKQDARPAGKPGECFYCRAAFGHEHAKECVLRTQTVVVEYTITLVKEYPESWDADMIDFHLNDSSWCAGNILDEIPDTCLCDEFKGRFVREATTDDEEEIVHCLTGDEENEA